MLYVIIPFQSSGPPGLSLNRSGFVLNTIIWISRDSINASPMNFSRLFSGSLFTTMLMISRSRPATARQRINML